MRWGRGSVAGRMAIVGAGAMVALGGTAQAATYTQIATFTLEAPEHVPAERAIYVAQGCPGTYDGATVVVFDSEAYRGKVLEARLGPGDVVLTSVALRLEAYDTCEEIDTGASAPPGSTRASVVAKRYLVISYLGEAFGVKASLHLCTSQVC